MEREIIRPTEIDGIELYVSSDGKHSGMSQTGLAVFIGIQRYALQQLLIKLDSATDANTDIPETLKPFIHKDSELPIEGYNNARIIPSDLCAAIVEYYAFESTRISNEVKQQALFSYRKFAAKGIHDWICESVGLIEENEIAPSPHLTQQLQEMMQTMILKLDNIERLEQATTKYVAIREKTTTYYPGANELLNELETNGDNLLEPAEDGSLSLEGWLKSKGITLDKSRFYRLAQIAAGTYKSLVKSDPPRRHFSYTDTSGQSQRKYNVYVYKPEYFPILQISLNKVLSE